MQHILGLRIFLGNVDLAFRQIPGGICDLEKVKSTDDSGRKRSEID